MGITVVVRRRRLRGYNVRKRIVQIFLAFGVGYVTVKYNYSYNYSMYIGWRGEGLVAEEEQLGIGGIGRGYYVNKGKLGLKKLAGRIGTKINLRKFKLLVEEVETEAVVEVEEMGFLAAAVKDLDALVEQVETMGHEAWIGGGSIGDHVAVDAGEEIGADNDATFDWREVGARKKVQENSLEEEEEEEEAGEGVGGMAERVKGLAAMLDQKQRGWRLEKGKLCENGVVLCDGDDELFE